MVTSYQLRPPAVPSPPPFFISLTLTATSQKQKLYTKLFSHPKRNESNPIQFNFNSRPTIQTTQPPHPISFFIVCVHLSTHKHTHTYRHAPHTQFPFTNYTNKEQDREREREREMRNPK